VNFKHNFVGFATTWNSCKQTGNFCYIFASSWCAIRKSSRTRICEEGKYLNIVAPFSFHTRYSRNYMPHFGYFTPPEGIRTSLDQSKGLREGFGSTYW